MNIFLVVVLFASIGLSVCGGCKAERVHKALSMIVSLQLVRHSLGDQSEV